MRDSRTPILDSLSVTDVYLSLDAGWSKVRATSLTDFWCVAPHVLKHEASRGFHIEGEPFSLKRREVASASCERHMDVSKSLGCRQFQLDPNRTNPLARGLPLS